MEYTAYNNFSFDEKSSPVTAKAPSTQKTNKAMDANVTVRKAAPKVTKPKVAKPKEPEAPKEAEPEVEAKSSPVEAKAPEVQNKTSMALVAQLTQLVAQRDAEFLKTIAADYKLDYEELVAKYLVKAPEVKKKREVKVKVTKDGEEVRCKGVTAKKEQCSFQPLKGQCFCKRHLPKEEAPKEEPKEEAPATEETPLSELMVIFTPETPVKTEDEDATQDLSSPRSLLVDFE